MREFFAMILGYFDLFEESAPLTAPIQYVEIVFRVYRCEDGVTRLDADLVKSLVPLKDDTLRLRFILFPVSNNLGLLFCRIILWQPNLIFQITHK
jgi:hypothetical protein